MAFTAKDVQALRQSTGSGMMDAKKALEANDGDIEAAKQWLREQGLAASAKRDDRDNAQGVVALVLDGQVGAIVELKSETDFVAGSEHFKLEAQELAHLVAAKGVDAVADRQDRIEDLKITLKEKIEVGRVVRIEAAPGDIIDSYLHIQGGRGVNAVLVVVSGGTPRARPRRRRPHRLRPAEVPVSATTSRPTSWPPSARRSRRSRATRASPRPPSRRSSRAASTGYFKTVALLDQPYAKDDKQSVAQLIGSASIVEFAQVEIG